VEAIPSSLLRFGAGVRREEAETKGLSTAITTSILTQQSAEKETDLEGYAGRLYTQRVSFGIQTSQGWYGAVDLDIFTSDHYSTKRSNTRPIISAGYSGAALELGCSD
jgi:hypothetical protein